MFISTKDWLNYINKLSALNTKAGTLMRDYVAKHGFEDTKAIIDYAYALVTKYGEGSAALSAEMYDTVAEMSGKILPAAEVAQTASYKEIAKAVYGTLRTSKNPESYGNITNRFVKRAGADTTLKNAERDGAQFAWVPFGDTCSFCITLASRGFQRISKKAYKNGHAEHIHANCDCAYTVRFDSNSGVRGYNPDKYRAMYDAAEGNTPKEKMNYMRRMQYEDPETRNKINAQKREAYAKREVDKVLDSIKSEDVTNDYIQKAIPGKGLIDKQVGFKDVNGEEKIGNWIYSTFGRDIIMLADNNPDGAPNPDYLWDEKLWDLKAPNSSNENTIDKRIQHGIWQIDSNTGGVIVDFSNSKLSFAKSIAIVDKYGMKRAKKTTDFIIKKNDEYKVLRVKK